MIPDHIQKQMRYESEAWNKVNAAVQDPSFETIQLAKRYVSRCLYHVMLINMYSGHKPMYVSQNVRNMMAILDVEFQHFRGWR